MADELVAVCVTPIKKSFSKAVSQAIFSRSNMKEKVRLLSRVFSGKKKRSWNPTLYSPEVFKEGHCHGSYDIKHSPVGLPTPVTSELKKDSSKLQKNNAVINLVNMFDLLATTEQPRMEKGDNSSHLAAVDTLELSPAVKTCVIDMTVSDVTRRINPFLSSDNQVNKCKNTLQTSGGFEQNVEPPTQPKSSLLPDPEPPTQLKSSLLPDPEVFKNLDKHSLEVSEGRYTDLRLLCDDLTGECQSELETVRVIFRWVIAMDQKNAQGYHQFMRSNALGSGKESCQKLFAKLCRQAGLHCEIIVGYSKGAGYKPGMRIDDKANRNSWTAVFIERSWRFVNCTWAARHLTGNQNELSSLLHKLDEFYFLTDPQEHIYQHYPDEQKWQLLESPITLEDFKRLPTLKSPFFKHGLKFTDNYSSPVTTDNGLIELRLRVPSLLEFGAKLEADGFDTFYLENCILTRIVDDEVLFRICLPRKGYFVLSAFAGSSDIKGYLECIFSLEITCEIDNKMAPFPPVPVLGRTRSLSQLGLSSLSHDDPYIHLESNSLQMDFIPGEEIKLTHTLQYYDEKSSSFIDIHRYAFMSVRTDDRLTYSIVCPRKGSYLFSVFGGLPHSQSYHCLYQYLIVCPSDDLSQLAFPKSSKCWVDCEIHAPLFGDLVQESNYFFHLTVPEAEEVVVLIGTDRYCLECTKGDNWSGHVFTGDVSSKAVVFASFALYSDLSTPKFERLLTYELL